MHILQRFCYVIFGTIPWLFAALGNGLAVVEILSIMSGASDGANGSRPLVGIMALSLCLLLMEASVLLAGVTSCFVSLSPTIRKRERWVAVILFAGGVGYLPLAIAALWPPPYQMDLQIFTTHPLQALWSLREQILGWGPPFVALHYLLRSRPAEDEHREPADENA